MKSKVCIVVAACCIAVFVAFGAAWFAHGQTTNATDVPSGFQVPMVRDLQLLNEVKALTKRVETLETKVKALESRGVRSR